MPVVQIPLDPMSAVARRGTLEMQDLVQVEFLCNFISICPLDVLYNIQVDFTGFLSDWLNKLSFNAVW